MTGKPLLGRTIPRLWTPPQRPLSRRTSLGYECADFMAHVAGEPFDPWQDWVTKHALELMPDGSFRFRIVLILVARQNGKSHLKRGITLWRMYMYPKTNVLGVAQDLSLARDQWQMAQDAIHAAPELQAEWDKSHNVNGDEWFRLANGSRYKIGASNRKSGRGQSVDELNFDELREQHTWDAWAALSKTTMARPNSQIWLMSNAGDDRSVVLNQLLEVARGGHDPTIFLAEYSAPDGCELDDWDAIRQSNPNLGRRVSAQSISTALSTDPPGVFRTEVLCQRVESLDGAIDMQRWTACADAAGTMDALRRKIAACVDVAPDGKHATLAVAGTLTDGRTRVEIVRAWDGTESARDELGGLLDRIRPVTVAWYPTGPGAAFATMLRRRPGSMEITGSKVGEACQELADLARAGRIVHPGDPLLDDHVRGASKLHSGDGWRFARNGEGHVDAAYAAAGAIYAARNMPAQMRARIRML